ncbi:M15 family metallopeptidase [Vibrio hannami]|uniref:M15 family metallopeptidase n=1 Tax=Vibrio hannami TaxID=2717094 RepID=UPI00240F72B4|nr:M15 family metallopeptidase [Vibrio hannami]MDG3088826.1 M15 family metallopeptidase [Vibrio hannami]
MTPQELTGQASTHLVEVETLHQSLLVHKEVADNLKALVESADKAGFQLLVASGFRDYSRQQLIWNRKYSGDLPILDKNSRPLLTDILSDEEKALSILRWSALPGASRHHWGTDFDVYAGNELPQDTKLMLEPWEYQSGHQSRFYLWLKNNLESHGFFFPYAKDMGGVSPEPWHISHSEVSGRCMIDLSPRQLELALMKAPILGLEAVRSNLDTIFVNYIVNICQE